jgi:general secretion pathway protein D
LRILASIVAATLLLAIPIYATKASDIYKKAEKLEKAGKVIEAFVLYSEASQMEPNNALYRAKSRELQPKAEYRQMQAKAAAAKGQAPAPVLDTAAKGDDADDLDNISTVELRKVRQMLPPPEVKLPTGHFDFHFSGTATEVFDKVAERCGLQTSYDSEWTATQKLRFDIEDVDCREALRATEAATNAFIVTLSSKLIFISKDTTQKRQTNEATMSVVIPVPTALTTQDLTEISQAVKQVSGVEKLSWNSASNEIVIRDRVSRALIAKRVVEQLTAFRGGVVFDLRFLELTTSDMLQYGVNLTNTFNINWVGSLNTAINSTNAAAGVTLNGLITALRQAPYAFAISSLQQSVIATLTQSNARTILATQIRSVNGMPATLHVGDKYPVITAGYYGPGSNSSSTSSSTGTVAGAYTPPPSFTYYDLGVSLKVNPMIGNSDLIALDIETEYQLLAGQAIDGIPILANRKLSTRICLHNDEWSVIGGLMNKTDNTSIAGVAGLANIPILGWFFRTKTREKDLDYIVIVMRPHLVGDPPSTHETAPMAVGSETRPLSPL